MKKSSKIALGIAVILLFSIPLTYWAHDRATPGKLDVFAKCIEQSGAKFYGAFWCPHCRNQKALFGKSVKYLPYVECANPDGRSQTQVCIDKNITGYPTWIFADGSRLSGEVPLVQLAQKTSCTLPAQ